MNNEELKREAEERARDFTDDKKRQVAYECGFLDGADRATEELKEKLAGAERTRDNLIQKGFPTFQSCKEYAELEKEKCELLGIIQGKDKVIKDLKDDNKVMSDNFSKMEQKFYDNLSKAKVIIKDLMNNSDEYARQRALDFLKKGENKK